MNFLPRKRVMIGLLSSILIFLVIRVIDEGVLNPTVYGNDIEDFIASSVRPVLAVFAAMTIGAIIARRGLLAPALVLVTLVWGAALASSYAHREDYVTTLRLVDLDWSGAIMAIIATFYGVKLGERISRSLRSEDPSAQ